MHGLHGYLNKQCSIITDSIKSVTVVFENTEDQFLAMPWVFFLHVPGEVQENILQRSDELTDISITTNNCDSLLKMYLSGMNF